MSNLTDVICNLGIRAEKAERERDEAQKQAGKTYEQVDAETRDELQFYQKRLALLEKVAKAAIAWRDGENLEHDYMQDLMDVLSALDRPVCPTCGSSKIGMTACSNVWHTEEYQYKEAATSCICADGFGLNLSCPVHGPSREKGFENSAY